MKRSRITLIGGVIALVLASFFGTAFLFRTLPVDRNETFLKFFSKERFLSKLSQKRASWMEEQIEGDFAPFSKISQKAIQATYEQIQEKTHLPKFVRYRIVDNQLYRYVDQAHTLSNEDTRFEKAIKTLTQVVYLPNLDFICSYMDGTPESYVPEDFYWASPQAPLLSWAKLKKAPFIVLIPDVLSLSEAWVHARKDVLECSQKIEWEDKLDRAFWRGSNSDQHYTVDNYLEKPRYRICYLSQALPDKVDAAFNVVYSKEMKEFFSQQNLISEDASFANHVQYKFLPTLDGYMCTYPGYQWRLLSNSLVLKQNSDGMQWFYRALKPYTHYVPIQNDLSDLLSQIEWAIKHDNECQQIVANATTFADEHLSLESIYVYLHTVLQKYAELQDFDYRAVSQETVSDPSWKCIQYRKKPKWTKRFRLSFFLNKL